MLLFADGFGKLCEAGLMLESGIRGSLDFLFEIVSPTTHDYEENEFKHTFAS